MSTQLNLREIERKAFTSTYQDGLWDIFLGLLVAGMSISFYRPPDGYSPMNIVLSTVIIVLAGILVLAGKLFITVPRMGQVRFGEIRKRKTLTLAAVLGVVILVQVGIVGFTSLGWAHTLVGADWDGFLGNPDASRMAVAAIGSLIVGSGMLAIVHFMDFGRGYWIALLMALAVFLMIYLNQPVLPVLIGVVILLPGLMLLVRFLKAYPLRREDSPHA